MQWTGIISLVIIILNVLVSYRGFSNHSWFARFSFEIDKILIGRDYKRLITSGFLHVNWWHLLFNMMALHSFSNSLEGYMGSVKFLIIYLASLLGDNLFALFVHRNHGDYTAVGASGAVCGVIFASLALFPGMGVSFFGMFPIPGWLFCIGFVLVSIYGIRSRSDNIGHEAHLAGALIGMLIAIIMQPSAMIYNYIPILLIVVPTVAFILFIIKRPASLLVDNHYFKTHPHFTLDDRYNIEKRTRQEEVDRILEKIHKKGINSLTRDEKKTLEAFSKSK